MTTVKNAIRATGTVSESGERIHLTIRPALRNTGIVFRRVDLDPVVEIFARGETITGETPPVTIKKCDVSVSGVEHIVSAFTNLGIDNALIELTGPEVPVMDGSEQSYLFLIESAGIDFQEDHPRLH